MQPTAVTALRHRAERRGYKEIKICKVRASEQGEQMYSVTAVDPLTQSVVSAEWSLLVLPHLLTGKKG
jgi:hypothetical protein